MAERVAERAVAEGGSSSITPLPGLSPKARFATKTALAITLAYMIPMAMGWNQPHQGAIAIMVIASAGPLGETLGKGVMRVLGTVAGALVGLALIALYPQDRFAYFLALSIASALVIYLYHSYQGDTTFWMIMLVVMVMLFNEGKVDDRFLYALDRSWTTAFGIFVYAMVSLYLWPDRQVESRVGRAKELTRLWGELAGTLGREKEEAKPESPKISAAEKALVESLRGGATEYPGGIAFDTLRWRRLLTPIRQIDAQWQKLLLFDLPGRFKTLKGLAPDFEALWREIATMVEAVESYWEAPGRLELPPQRKLTPDRQALEAYDSLERAHLLSLLRSAEALHEGLRELLRRLDRIASPEPDLGEIAASSGPPAFVWGDPEAFKGTLVSLLIFWTGLAFWILANPPGGFMVPALAFVLSLVILFTPINPLLLIVVFTFSFLFSFLSYVFVLPHLHEWWELALYMFGYMFVAYYVIPGPAALFFALGLTFQFIDNNMFFSFQLFVSLLLVFYLFLGLLLIFNYLPIPNRPEYFFRQLERRFLRQVRRLFFATDPGPGRAGVWGALLRRYALQHLPRTFAKLKLWSSQIDYGYFDRVDREAMEGYLERGERIVTLLGILEGMRASLEDNALFRELRERLSRERGPSGTSFPVVPDSEGEEAMAARRQQAAALIRRLDRYLASVDWRRYPEREITEVAEYLTLRKLLWESLVAAAALRERIGLDQLKWSRF